MSRRRFVLLEQTGRGGDRLVCDGDSVEEILEKSSDIAGLDLEEAMEAIDGL